MSLIPGALPPAIQIETLRVSHCSGGVPTADLTENSGAVMGIRQLTDYNKVGKSRGVDDQLRATSLRGSFCSQAPGA